jgi:Ni/Fe-hydrogenase subunit HybB-like protein
VEFAPVVLEKAGMSKLGHFIHRFTIPFVIGGVIFSTLHQSSLGSLYLIVPTKLVPLWYTPLLPLFFFLSAIAVGLSMVVIVSALCRRFLGKGVEDRVIVSLGRFVTVVLLLFLGIRVLDMTLRDAWVAIFDYPLQGALFLVEEGALVAAAVILLLRPWQARAGDVRAAAVLVLVGVVLHRLNVAWFGLIPALGSAYVPSWKEIAVTLMLISLATVVFALAAKYLDLFQEGTGVPNPTRAAGGIADSSAVHGTRPEPAAAK